jgi:hypothetical protein
VSSAVAPARAEVRGVQRIGEIAVLIGWAGFVGLSVIDLLSTIYGLAHHLVELNPLTRIFLNAYGVPGLWGYKAVILVAVLWGVPPLPLRGRLVAFLLLDTLMWVVVTSNLNILGQLGAPR